MRPLDPRAMSEEEGASPAPRKMASSEPLKKKKKKKKKPEAQVIGWREWVALPELGVAAVKAKIDTGARSSALHAFDVEIVLVDGIEMVRFTLHPMQRDSKTTCEAEIPLHDRRWIRNSGGKRELRPVIRTKVHVHGIQYPIDLTLTRRDAMGFRMLLGREAVRGRFLVDPGRSYRSVDPVARKRRKKRSSRSPQ